MSSKMNLQGLLAVLEARETDLFARRETKFAPVPLTGVHQEVCQQLNNFPLTQLQPLYFFLKPFSGEAGGGTC